MLDYLPLVRGVVKSQYEEFALRKKLFLQMIAVFGTYYFGIIY
jgi:hypothetical protein